MKNVTRAKKAQARRAIRTRLLLNGDHLEMLRSMIVHEIEDRWPTSAREKYAEQYQTLFDLVMEVQRASGRLPKYLYDSRYYWFTDDVEAAEQEANNRDARRVDAGEESSGEILANVNDEGKTIRKLRARPSDSLTEGVAE